MQKTNIRRELKDFYGTTTRQRFVLVDVPEMNFLMVDGKGNPNTAQSYKGAIEALYSLSYALKFMVKRSAVAVDYGVMPLEGLWWADDMSDFKTKNHGKWKWTMMIMQPHWVDADLVASATAATQRKKKLPALPKLRFEAVKEGRAAQCLYVGPYSEEASTIEQLHGFIQENGYELSGKHHEIYLNDARRTDPSRLKTILRQPLK